RPTRARKLRVRAVRRHHRRRPTGEATPGSITAPACSRARPSAERVVSASVAPQWPLVPQEPAPTIDGQLRYVLLDEVIRLLDEVRDRLVRRAEHQRIRPLDSADEIRRGDAKGRRDRSERTESGVVAPVQREQRVQDLFVKM